MNELLFQNIFDKLQTALPSDWVNTVFYASYSEGSYSMKYFVDFGDGKYVDCFTINNNTNMQLAKLFVEIDKEISLVRETLDSKNKWNVITLKVGKDGEFKAYFDYDDISEKMVTYEQLWKEKYLK